MPDLSPDQAIADAAAGRLRPVYVISGEERYFRQQVLAAMRKAVVGAGEASLNEDRFVAGETDVGAVLAAARTLPMFGPRRLVVVNSVERWEAKETTAKPASARSKGVVVKPLDQLADYCSKASETTTLLLVSDKLDNRRRLVTAAKKGGFYVPCQCPANTELPGWIRRRVADSGHEISGAGAELLAELVGADLCALCDAIERVELFVGKGKPLTEEAVMECVTNLQAASVWDLVGAVGRRDAAGALRALDQVFEPGGGPRLVGLLSWSARQLIRFSSARRAGLSPGEAARKASVPSFKVREIAEQSQQLPLARAELWLETLAQVDFDLKGGSRLPQKAVLETAVLAFCR